MKTFFLRACIKEIDDTRFYFRSEEGQLFCSVFVFRRGMSNAIYDLMRYLQSEGLNIISWYNSIPVQNGILNTVYYSITNQRPVYLSKM